MDGSTLPDAANENHRAPSAHRTDLLSNDDNLGGNRNATRPHSQRLERRRSERCRCQTSALAFSALRAPNGKLFRASRSKAPEGIETNMTAWPIIYNDSDSAREASP